jgi:hypothetical protein
MAATDLVVRYDGLTSTTDHAIDMRRFGQALIGLDQVITIGIVALTANRLPRRRERLSFNIIAGEPKANCVSIGAGLATAYNAAQSSFPFAASVIQAAAPDFLWNWVSWVFKMLGGRMKEADPHFLKLMEWSLLTHFIAENLKIGKSKDSFSCKFSTR